MDFPGSGGISQSSWSSSYHYGRSDDRKHDWSINRYHCRESIQLVINTISSRSGSYDWWSSFRFASVLCFRNYYFNFYDHINNYLNNDEHHNFNNHEYYDYLHINHHQ